MVSVNRFLPSVSRSRLIVNDHCDRQIPTTGGFTEDAFHRFLKGRDEPAWLVERRREAFARFRAFPWPGAREEEWRRTDIRALKLDAFAPPAAGEPEAPSPSPPSTTSGTP